MDYATIGKKVLNLGTKYGKHKVPRFIYHMTNKTNYESMLRDGFIKTSPDVTLGRGVFATELTNLFKRWRLNKSWRNADGMKIAFNDGGGYIYTTVGKNNKVFVERQKIDDYLGGAIENVKEINHATNILPENLENLRETYKKMGLELRDGYVNGRRVVSFSICPRKNPKTLMMRHFWLKTASNDGNLTPMQRDLWKLMEHLDKIDPEIFHKIAEFEYGKGFVNANYDLILSAIQTMAKGL